MNGETAAKTERWMDLREVENREWDEGGKRRLKEKDQHKLSEPKLEQYFPVFLWRIQFFVIKDGYS